MGRFTHQTVNVAKACLWKIFLWSHYFVISLVNKPSCKIHWIDKMVTEQNTGYTDTQIWFLILIVHTFDSCLKLPKKMWPRKQK